MAKTASDVFGKPDVPTNEAFVHIQPAGGAEDEAEEVVQERPSSSSGYVAPSRRGRLHLSAWLPPIYKKRMRELQVKFPDTSLQDLYAEALEDLYAKHGLRPVTQDAESASEHSPREISLSIDGQTFTLNSSRQ